MKTCPQCWGNFSGRSKYCQTCAPYCGKGVAQTWYRTIEKYGVDKVMWDAMYFEQDGKCLICQDREAIVVDHDHATGKARGLLCKACNGLLGFMENKERVNRALDYLKGELV